MHTLRFLVLYLAFCGFSVATILALMYLAWQRRHMLPEVAWYFLLASVGGLLWAGGEALYLLSPSPAWSFNFNRASAVGSALVPVFFLAAMMALDRHRRRWARHLVYLGVGLTLASEMYVRLFSRKIPEEIHFGPYTTFYVHTPTPWWVTALWLALTVGMGIVAIVYFFRLYRPVWKYTPRWYQMGTFAVLIVVMLGAIFNITKKSISIAGMTLDLSHLEAFPPFLWFFFWVFAGGVLRLYFDVSPVFSADAVLNRLQEGVLVFDVQDYLVWWNQKAEKMLHLSRQEHRAAKAQEVLARWPWLWERYRARETLPRIVNWQKDGQEGVWEIYNILLRDARATPLGWVLLFRDLTRQRQLEYMLQYRAQSELLYHRLMALAIEPVTPDQVLERGARLIYQYLSDYGLEALALYRRADGRLSRVFLFGRAPSEPPAELPLEGGQQTQKWNEGLIIPLKRDREVLGALWARWRELPFDLQETILQAGNILAHLWVVKREHERRRLLQEVYQNIYDSVLLFDAQGRILAANPAAERLTGYTQEELTRLSPQRVFRVSPEDLRDALHTLAQEGVWTEHIRIRTKDGQEKVAEVRVTQIAMPARRLFVAVFRDLTETESLQARLARQRFLLEHLLEAARSILGAPLDVQDVFREAVRVGREVTNAEYFALVLIHPDGTFRRLLLDQQDPQVAPDILEERLRASLREGVLRTILQGRMPTYVPDTHAQEPWKARAHLYPWRTLFLEPLYYGKTPLGMFMAGHSRPDAFTEEQRNMLSGLAEILALGLQHARLYEDQQQLAQEWLKAKEREEWLRRREERFLSNMSHEMRTPLQSLLGYLEMIEAKPPETPLAQLRPDFEEVQRAAYMLFDLVTQLLHYQRARAGMEVEPEAFRWGDLLQELRPLVQPLMDRNQNEFEVQADPDLEMVSDRTKILHILLNLLSNAAKFTLQGRVTLMVRPAVRNGVDGVEIRVVDTGIGIPEDAQKAIFDPFVQARKEIAHRFGGTGLGLALVKQYVDWLQGHVEVKSEVGKGSTFIVWLPRQWKPETEQEAVAPGGV